MKQHSNSNRIMEKRVFMGFVLFFISIASAVAQDILSEEQDPAIDYAAFTRLRNNDDAMEEFLKENDNALYRQFHTGASLRQSGKTFLGLGLVLTGVGVGLFVVGAIQINDNPDFGSGFNLALVGATCFSVGQVFTIVSIPLSAVGGGLKRRAANGYEEKYFNRSKTYSRTSLNLTLTGNGVGFALRF